MRLLWLELRDASIPLPFLFIPSQINWLWSRFTESYWKGQWQTKAGKTYIITWLCLKLNQLRLQAQRWLTRLCGDLYRLASVCLLIVLMWTLRWTESTGSFSSEFPQGAEYKTLNTYGRGMKIESVAENKQRNKNLCSGPLLFSSETYPIKIQYIEQTVAR